jgi:hypothetical protein
MAIDGNIDLGDLSGQDIPFLLEGSLEPPLTLPLLLSVAAAGVAGGVVDGYGPGLTLPVFTLADAGMADGMVLPLFDLAAEGEAGSYITGGVDLLAPQLAGSLEPPLALPALQLAASGSAGQLLTAQFLQLELLQLAAAGGDGGATTLEPFTASGELLAGTVAGAALSLPGLTLAATALQDASGAGDITFAPLRLNASATSSTVIDASITIAAPTLAAVAVAGTVGDALLTVPLFDLAADAFSEAIGSATLMLPLFALHAADTLTVPRPVLTTVVLNTRLKGVSRYDGLAANSFARFAGIELAATPDGIVALMGDTDLGAPIAASIVAGTSDFGAAERKRIDSAFVGYRSGSEMEMTLITDEHHEYTYRLAPRQIGDTLHGTRVKFGRGVDGRYWQWKLANTAGAGFDLAGVQLNVIPLARAV